ncbi:MAG: ATP-binding protein [Actinomycetota bacterium]
MPRSGGTVRATVANAPIKWKILTPFALLSLTFGGMGAFVLSSGVAAESRARQTTGLRDASAVASNRFESRVTALATSARQAAFTEGLADAVSRGDIANVRRLLLPLASGMKDTRAVVSDRRGRGLVDVVTDFAMESIVTAGTDWGGVEAVRAAARGKDAGAAAAQFVVQEGTPYVVVAMPIQQSGRTVVGVVLFAETLRPILDVLESLTKSQLGLVDSAGRVLAGREMSVPASKVSGVAQVRGRMDGVAVEVLTVPVTLRGRRAATLRVASPVVSRFGVLGDDGVKIGLITMALLMAVFVVGVWVSGLISKPLGHLVESTRALRRGDFSHRAHLEGTDEVGELAESFNRMAEDLEASHRDLEQRVENRTHELEEALVVLDHTNAELTQANDAKSLFLANVSHELRTPLSGILIASEMLHDPAFGMFSEEKVRDLGGKILSSGRHLLALIDDLLDLSRIEAGRLELRPQPVDVALLLDDLRLTIEPAAAEKRVKVDIPSGGDCRIYADPVRALQVLFNLASNAVKFTPSGGRVWLEVTKSKGDVAIAVHDTGIGIARRDLVRIFEPFEQVSDRRMGGAGLGLAVSKRIVDLHGGSIKVSSVPGKGSRFTAVFSAADPGAARPAVIGNGDVAEAVRPARVLVVEDDPVTQDLVYRALCSGGHHVDRAASVREAISRVRARKPDVVLLDVRLGKDNGLDVVPWLRSRPATAGMQVIVLSAHGMPGDIDRAMAAGCDDYLVKPVAAKTLLAKIAAVMDAREPKAGEVRKAGRG